MEEPLRHAPIGVIETTTEGQITDVNETAASLVEAPPESLVGADIRQQFPKSAAGVLREAFAGETPSSRSFVEFYPAVERWLAVDVRTHDGVVVYIRDRTEYHETEQTVTRLERRLDRIQRINALIATVLTQVINATEKTEIGQTVCERLGGTDLYAFAWAGDREFSEDRIRVVAASDTASEMREQVKDVLDGTSTLPGRDAVETGESQLVEHIAGDTTVPRGVRESAFKHGLQSCLAVPLAYRDTVYGVVSVFSDRESGFSEQERAGLETLGSVAGFAIKAIRQEELLAADTVTEVTVEVRDRTVPFVRVADETSTELSLEAAVPRGDGAVVCYIGVADSADGVVDELGRVEDVDGVRWIRSTQDPLLQATVDGQTPVTTLATWGARVNAADFTPEAARLVVTVPPDGDVRQMIETLDETVRETNLIAKERRTRDAEPTEAFRNALDERLTERQRTVLRAAYLADYFESPRGSTSEEVADSLGIAGPTMLHHLRRAQKKLIGTVLEFDPGTDPTAPD